MRVVGLIIALVALVALVLVAVTWQQRGSALARVAATEREVRMNVRPDEDEPTRAEKRAQLLSVLKASTPTSLNVPMVGAATASKVYKGPGIAVWWIEGSPTADGVSVRSVRSGQTLIVPLDAVDRAANLNTAKSYVMFDASIPLSEPWAEELADHGLEVAMVRGGRVVSAYRRVLTSNRWLKWRTNQKHPTTRPIVSAASSPAKQLSEGSGKGERRRGAETGTSGDIGD